MCLFVNHLGCFYCYIWQLSEQKHGACYISMGMQVHFGRVLYLKHHICGLCWQQSPGVTRRLIQTHYCDAWVQISAGVTLGGWWLSYRLNLNLVKKNSPPSSRCPVIFTHHMTCSAHKRWLVEQSSMYHYRSGHHLQWWLQNGRRDVCRLTMSLRQRSRRTAAFETPDTPHATWLLLQSMFTSQPIEMWHERGTHGSKRENHFGVGRCLSSWRSQPCWITSI